ncbi:hypothetical protein EDC04DRAFT_1397633 [Pisolithus marmoratus]|nr:hypothetical protein EDC04DRAFT_1397633 [Pisolithus marmoratus]
MSMSSLTSATGPPSAATSAPSFTHSTTSTSNSNLGSSSTLLFVFLISVLSLFSAFLTCGIVWHRLVSRRRMIDAILQTGSPPTVEMPEKPGFWDVKMVPQPRVAQMGRYEAAGNQDRAGYCAGHAFTPPTTPHTETTVDGTHPSGSSVHVSAVRPQPPHDVRLQALPTQCGPRTIRTSDYRC